MPYLSAVIVERGPTPGVMVRQANNLAKEAWEGAAYYWGEKIRERHFWANAAAMYGYRPRTARYEARKQKQYGHKRPLVYSGETEELTRGYIAKSTNKGATVKMKAFALNLCRRGDELRAINDPEAKEIARIWKDDFDKILWRFRGGFKSTEIK